MSTGRHETQLPTRRVVTCCIATRDTFSVGSQDFSIYIGNHSRARWCLLLTYVYIDLHPLMARAARRGSLSLASQPGGWVAEGFSFPLSFLASAAKRRGRACLSSVARKPRSEKEKRETEEGREEKKKRQRRKRKSRRKRLTIQEKQEIIKFSRSNPQWTQEDLAKRSSNQ